MRQVTDVIEGSIVSSGSQGTGFIAAEQRSALFSQTLQPDSNVQDIFDLSVDGKHRRIWADE